ncbi:PREDICTED: perlucin-like [Branchiostoma belcheri]|uniref:Perlucin-like n=1 Tax=Branchiostoma belcheri TaxID=7741 RepID=A0A6P5AQ63_BRABE|nr:PREDICTED: perlucin-like [Branchiostoma belcheri]
MTFSTCPYGYHQYRRVCYKVFLSPQTFTYATTGCQLDGGTLAIPRDAGINAFLLNLIAMHAHPPSSFWFGLHDRDYEGQWTWVDGTALGDGYTAWIPGQPDNSRDRQDCVYYRGDWNYLWDDRECNAAYFFICQVFSSGSPPPTTEIPTTTRP